MINENFTKILKSIIEFMWKDYGISIVISDDIENNKNILGTFTTIPIESRTKLKNINVDLKNLRSIVSEKNLESAKLFVVLHEVGHFLLDKSRYIQKEEYADLLACLIAKKILTKYEFLSFFKISRDNLFLCQIFQIEDEYKSELIEISDLFYYKYQKHLKLRGEL